MAVKKILQFPEAGHVLRAKSAPVRPDDPELAGNIADLRDTLLNTANALGLAGPQLGILKRIFLLRKDYIAEDLDPASPLLSKKGNLLVFINPKIISEKGVLHQEEGCLSVAGEYPKITRSRVVKVRFQDETGEQYYERFKDLGARAVQQEIDHLNGILIIDRE